MASVGISEVELLCPEGSHDGVEDTELSGGKGTDHDATRKETDGAKVDEAGLGGDVSEALDQAAFSSGSSLVDLGEEGVGGVGDDCGGDSGNDTGGEGDAEVGPAAELGGGLAEAIVNLIGGGTLHGELGHGVGDLLAEDGSEAGVEPERALGLENLGEAVHEAVAELGIGDGADTDRLEGAEEEIGDELGTGSGSEVDGGLVLPRLLLSHVLDSVNFEKLDSAELEPALDEVSGSGGAEAGGQGPGTLLSDDGAEATDQACVILREQAAGTIIAQSLWGRVGQRRGDQ